jgi:hypothetical protein
MHLDRSWMTTPPDLEHHISAREDLFDERNTKIGR